MLLDDVSEPALIEFVTAMVRQSSFSDREQNLWMPCDHHASLATALAALDLVQTAQSDEGRLCCSILPA